MANIQKPKRNHPSTSDSSFGDIDTPVKVPNKQPNKTSKTDTSISDQIDQIIKEKFEHLKLELTGEFSNTRNAIVHSISERLESIELKVDNVTKENEFLKKEVTELKQKNETFLAYIDSIEEHIHRIDAEHNDLAQHSRKSNVRIWGMQDDGQAENSDITARKVWTLLRTKMKMNIDFRDIDIAHRLGPPRQPVGQVPPKPRPVIVRFMRRTCKTETMAKRSKVKKDKIFIHEDLTKFNADLLSEAQQDGRVEYAYVREGKIYAKLIALDRVNVVKCLEDIDYLDTVFGNYDDMDIQSETQSDLPGHNGDSLDPINIESETHPKQTVTQENLPGDSDTSANEQKIPA